MNNEHSSDDLKSSDEYGMITGYQVKHRRRKPPFCFTIFINIP
jgi:hypothetical protein